MSSWTGEAAPVKRFIPHTSPGQETLRDVYNYTDSLIAFKEQIIPLTAIVWLI